jgi:DNA primase
LKRFTTKVVLSFDPDAAGQGAAARSSELLVSEGFQVNVALLPEGSDPDAFIRGSGPKAYTERLTGSKPYLDFLLDRAAARLDVGRADSRKTFLDEMFRVAATIPDPVVRDQFADRLAHKARITEGVIREEIKRAAAQRKTEAPALAVAPIIRVGGAEQGLLWSFVHRPVEGLSAVAQLEASDLERLVTAPILTAAAGLSDVPPDVLPELLRERLSEGERALLERAAAADSPMASAADCVRRLKLDRLERDMAELQREIERLGGADADDLLERKQALVRKIEGLKA